MEEAQQAGEMNWKYPGYVGTVEPAREPGQVVTGELGQAGARKPGLEAGPEGSEEPDLVSFEGLGS